MSMTAAFAPMIMMGIVMITTRDLFFKLIAMVPTVLKIAMSIADPEVFIRDIIYGLFTALRLLMSSIFGIITGIGIGILNKVGLTDDFFGLKKNKNKKCLKYNVKCVKPTFLKIIILIVCPPLYVFLKKGISGWIYIIFDIILTLFFYFPGLIYAVLLSC